MGEVTEKLYTSTLQETEKSVEALSKEEDKKKKNNFMDSLLEQSLDDKSTVLRPLNSFET